MFKKNNKKGFTLTEMLIVVAIIAVLVGIMIPTVSGSLVKAKEAADVANIRSFYAEKQIDISTNGVKLANVDDTDLKSKLNFASKYTFDKSTGAITYKAAKLNNDTTSSGGKTFEWTLHDDAITEQ